MKYIKEYNSIKNRNIPTKVVADERGLAVVKMAEFKENHTIIGFSTSQIRLIEDLLNKKKSKVSYEWIEFLEGSDTFNQLKDKDAVYLKLTYKEWTTHQIKQFRDGYSTYLVYITAYEDEWFTISKVSKKWGYTSLYIADQMDELLNYLDEI